MNLIVSAAIILLNLYMLHMALVNQIPMLFCQYAFRKMFSFHLCGLESKKYLLSCILVIRHLGDYIIQVIPWVLHRGPALE